MNTVSLSLMAAAHMASAAVAQVTEPVQLTQGDPYYRHQDPYVAPPIQTGQEPVIVDSYGNYTYRLTRVDNATLTEVISAWTGRPRELADELVAKYGEPHEADSGYLVWHNNGVWKMTLLENIEASNEFPDGQSTMLYQMIDYSVPEDRFDDLAELDLGIIADRVRGTLGARSESEAENFLKVNLADDVIRGERSGSNARDFHSRTVGIISSGNGDSNQQAYVTGLSANVMANSRWRHDRNPEVVYTSDASYGPSIAYPNGRTPVPDYSKPYEPRDDDEHKAKMKEKCEKHKHLNRHWDANWEWCPKDHWGGW